MRARRLPVLLPLLALAATQGPPASSGDPFAAAVAHYRAGRHAEAFAGFGALRGSSGTAPGAELLVGFSLAALRLQRTAEAEGAARELAALADARDRADGAFLLGLAAFQRAERAEAAAKLQDPEPGAFDAALQAVDQAIGQWLAADRARDGWPEAVRNAERAAHKRRQLQQDRAAAERDRPQSRKEPAPEARPKTESDPEPQQVDPELTAAALPAQELARLLDRLQQREREKRLVRQAQQRAAASAGERDW